MAKRVTISMATVVRRISRPLLLSLVLLASLTPPGLAEQQQTVSDEPRVMRGFVLQSELGPPSRVIDTPEALAEFVSCLPEELPSKREPSPPNPDPMRKSGFKLDFSKEVLVVVVHRDTISAFPVYKSSVVGKGGRVVNFDVPNPPPEARPYGWGVYSAVVLPKVATPTRIQKKAVKGDW